MDLFDLVAEKEVSKPLAERMKPRTLEEFEGQEAIMSAGGSLERMIQSDSLTSLILHGPPGSGKTSLARIIAATTKAEFITVNAVVAGIKDIKDAAVRGEDNLKLYGRRTILFIDEIHRFNKLQQDALLPYVETGKIILIGATTENPYFEVNPALLSRALVFKLSKLSVADIVKILERAISDKDRGLGTYHIQLEEGILETIAKIADGDARRALTTLEMAVNLAPAMASEIILNKDSIYAVQKMSISNREDFHYDVTSAFIKSMRGTDPDAALHYLAHLLAMGEDPMFIARRICICASEDVGNADPMALVLASSAMNAVHLVGMPEARIILAQAATYVAMAPKSNAAYLGIDRAMKDIEDGLPTDVPTYLRDGTSLSLELRKGLGEEAVETYQYPHDYPGSVTDQAYLPEGLRNKRYYEPKGNGFESEIIRRFRKERNETQ